MTTKAVSGQRCAAKSFENIFSIKNFLFFGAKFAIHCTKVSISTVMSDSYMNENALSI